MARSCWLARRHVPAIWVGNSNGTNGRVGANNSSLSKLRSWNWNLERYIATGTHNSEPLNNLERRLPAPGGKARGRRGLGPVTLLLKRDSASRPSGDCRNFLLDSCR